MRRGCPAPGVRAGLRVRVGVTFGVRSRVRSGVRVRAGVTVRVRARASVTRARRMLDTFRCQRSHTVWLG